MKVRIGISVSATQVAAVAVRRGRIEWSEGVILEDCGRLTSALAEVLQAASRFKGARYTCVMDRAYVRVKPIDALSSIRKERVAAEAVRANPERFFIGFDGGSTLAGVWKAEGRWYSASYSTAAVAAVNEACESARVSLDEFLPFVLAVPTAAQVAEADCAELFTGAFGAALTSGTSKGALVSRQKLAKRARAHRAKRFALAASVAASALAAAAAPSVTATRAERNATAATEEQREQLRPVAASMADLAETSRKLDLIDRFDLSRRSSLRFLAALAHALPDSSALTSFRLDTSIVNIVVVSRSGPSILARLTETAWTESPQVIGALSHEQIGGVEMDRIATRARFIESGRTAPRVKAP